jgi:hypothetical protein
MKLISRLCKGKVTSMGFYPFMGDIFLLSTLSRPVLGSTQPPIQWVPGALSPGIKQPGLEADHSPPTIAEIKNMWICTSTPPYVFMA